MIKGIIYLDINFLKIYFVQFFFDSLHIDTIFQYF